MIIVDTSVVIDYARGKDAKLLALLPVLPVAICGIVRAELLCGVRDSKDRANLLTLLSTFAPFPIPDSIWDGVGDNLAALRTGGLTVPFPDVVLSTLAIGQDIELWA